MSLNRDVDLVTTVYIYSLQAPTLTTYVPPHGRLRGALPSPFVHLTSMSISQSLAFSILNQEGLSIVLIGHPDFRDFEDHTSSLRGRSLRIREAPNDLDAH